MTDRWISAPFRGDPNLPPGTTDADIDEAMDGREEEDRVEAEDRAWRKADWMND